MLSSANRLARENAAGALMHLAQDPLNRVAIARAPLTFDPRPSGRRPSLYHPYTILIPCWLPLLFLTGELRESTPVTAGANGILPLVNILDDGTDLAHEHAAEALLRLATNNVENQIQSSKNLVALLANENTGTQRRTAHVISELAAMNPSSPVSAGAILPLAPMIS
jgi:hypothetical protein